MKELYELKEQLMDELREYRGKQKKSIDDITVIKYLSSAIDHIGNIIEKGDEEYSGRQGSYYSRTGHVYDGRSFGNSYRRDSMGRYSREGLADKLRELMDDSPDEHTRMEIKRLIDKM